MRAGVVDWICNLVVVVSLALIVLNVFFLFYDDFFNRYAKGTILGETREPDMVPGLRYTVQFSDPKTGQKYQTYANPISVGERKVGDDLPVLYRFNHPEAFEPGGDPTYRLFNTIKVFAALGAFIAVAFGVRFLMASRA